MPPIRGHFCLGNELKEHGLHGYNRSRNIKINS